MRYIVFFLLFLSIPIFAQKSDTIRIDSLPAKNIRLDKGWKWHAGDNADWAKKDFDDSAWDTINLKKPINAQKQITDAEIAWFRLTVLSDSLVTNKVLCFLVKQAGASEIYLNGQLLRTIGVVSKDASKEKIQTSVWGIPTYFTFNRSGKQVFAVKYSFSKGNKILPFGITGNTETFGAAIVKPDGYWSKTMNTASFTVAYHMSLAGLFLMMSALHFILFLYNRTKSINRIFAITLFLAFLHFTMGYFMNVTVNSIHADYYTFIYIISIIVYICLLCYTLITYLEQEKTIYFWMLFTSYIVIGLLAVVISANWILYAYIIIVLLLLIEVFRVIIKSKKTGHKDVRLLLNSMSLLIVFLLLRFSIVNYLVEIDSIQFWANFFMIAFYLCTPLTLSILIAKNNARTEIALEKKLIEVETLSSEKQQILASQNETLEKKVQERTAALNLSLETLKATQNQLIQSEKLASLGELTAGIAHEIQNPLNFVNNFSELSVELATELKEELEKTDIDKGLILDLATDLSSNQEKINHHGKRASSIVKSMLEHSRASTGIKELADINKLADEYLRLSYHGLRAKDKTFNADFKTDLADNLPKINIIQQDIGRVLLNLVNNAFYAVNQRQQLSIPSAREELLESSIAYHPSVSVSTEVIDNQIVVKIKDNGTGMPDTVKAKIFQPFFTTKPTGQGTGLGLSLAYDIVTKGHGGTLEVHSKEGEGTIFCMKLPVE